LGSDGTAWLIGFGEYPPREPSAVGNLLHVAPEQLEAGWVMPASDVYALAETALWLLTGRHPFAGLRSTELPAAKHTSQLSRQTWESRPSIPPAVERVLRRGLAANPMDRYAKAGEFATALASVGQLGRRSNWWRFWR
jgi:serine/threonine-protein kinase